jgi:hypothetical protein
MVQELPIKNSSFPCRFKRYFESKKNRIRIFGQCEVTGRSFEIHVPVEGFFVYLQGFKNIAEALIGTSAEEREFILTGTSPRGRKIHKVSIPIIDSIPP